MATRPVFEIGYSAPYYIEQPIDFVWNKGLNINQKCNCTSRIVYN